MEPSADSGERRRVAIVASTFGLLLLLFLWAHLVAAMLLGVGAYLLLRGAWRLTSRHMPPRWARPAARVVALGAMAVAVAALGIAVDAHFEAGGLPALLELLADTLDRLRSTLPAWAASRVPVSIDQVQHVAAGWLRSNAQDLQRWGHELVRAVAHAFIGIVVGTLVALEAPLESQSPWLGVARARGRNFVASFTDILFAQVRIAAANTVLTALFLLAALPAAGIHLPFAGVLVGLTFFTGLLPIVGNLLSNAAILLAAVTVSPAASIAALAFLLVIHKLEYVLNAHFVGRRTQVPASALLASMLLLEVFFGIGGLIAAPIYCAWLFREWRDSGLL